MKSESSHAQPSVPGAPGASETPRPAFPWTAAGVALLVAGALATVNVFAWRLEAERHRREIEYRRGQFASDLSSRIAAALDAELAKGGSLAATMAKSRAPVSDFPILAQTTGVSQWPPYLSAAWVNAEGTCDFAWTCAPNENVLRPRAQLDGGDWRRALGRARLERRGQVVGVERVADCGEMLFVLPATSGEGSAPGFQGFVASRIAVGPILEPVLAAATEAEYDAELAADGVPLAVHGRPLAASDVERVEARVVRVLNRSFELRVRPSSQAFAGGMPANVARWLLGSGWLASAGITALLFYSFRRRRADATVAARQVNSLRSLTETARVISAAPGAAREALDRLARTARDLLDTRMASVWVLDESARRVEAVARAGYAFRTRDSSYSLDEVPGTRECVGRGEIVVVDDVTREKTGRVNTGVLLEHGVRSAMIVPLMLGGRVIGTLFLAHERAGAFSEADRRLAGLLGSHAGVILANSKVHEQKDAALAAQKELTKRHEALYQIATEIFRAQDLEASLQRMAEAAPALLGVDICMVSLRTDKTRTRIAAVTGNYANCIGERNSAENTNIGRVWRSRRPLVIEDAPHDASLHPGYRHRLHVGSIIYLPLLGTGGEPIGTMSLIRHAPGPFTTEVREMADALAARAAVAIETARLHEDARRAAQTQTMLLRELNHRVKNNLASIVALLAMDRPPMPPAALSWVNRVSGRIATMARTHELFVGGNDRIDLRDLVARLLPALSLIKPQGAEVRAEFDGVQVALGTERAVSLAMVLNELCWNGLEHGTRQDGVLHIRGRGPEEGRLVVEVEDQGINGHGVSAGGGNGHGTGGQAAVVAKADGGRGTGLRLVEGLVSRELRGRFVVDRTAGGGTVARVEIPLELDESAGVSL